MTRLRLRVRQQGRLVSIRGIEIENIEPSTIVSVVPGSGFHMALVRGQIIPVLRLGAVDGCLVVGRVDSEIIGLTGLDIVDFALEPLGADDVSIETPSDPSNAEDSQALASRPESELEATLDVAALIATAKQATRLLAQPLQEAT